MKADLRKTVRLVRLMLMLVLLTLTLNAAAVYSAPAKPLTVTLFWQVGCPYCEQEKIFLDSLLKQYPDWVKLDSYEIRYNVENRAKLLAMAEAYGIKPTNVPVTFVADEVWIGFNEQIEQEISTAVSTWVRWGGQDPSAYTEPKATKEMAAVVRIPFLDPIDVAEQPLLLGTALIAFVDGLNPCSLWVLSLLLAIVVHTGSRRKAFLVGGVFILVTSLVYGLFLAGLFSVFSYIGYLRWIQIAVAVLALAFGIVNVKDYFWFRKGFSLTISDQGKSRVYQGIRKVVSGDKTWATVGGTAAMALGTSLAELPCTAGFPVVWSNIIAENGVSGYAFASLLGLYLLIYLMDELVLFTAALFTLRVNRFEEKHGRLLKLLGGLVMLSLAFVMLFRPDVMNTLNGSLLVFAIALLTAAVIILVHSKILPKYRLNAGGNQKKTR